MKLYDKIYKWLQDIPSLRYDDRELIWKVWESEKKTQGNFISKDAFKVATLPEDVRRLRQKIMESHPEVGRNGESDKERTKGVFVYHKREPVFDDKTNTMKYVESN